MDPPSRSRSEQLSLGPGAAADRPEEISGLVERVTFHSEETGFCVLRVRLGRRREPATVVGRAAAVAAGETVAARGSWVRDAEHGLQFRARELRVTPPATPEGTLRYLGSGAIRGVGPHTARRLVEAFGAEVFDVIESSPERLREVRGIGAQRAGRIAAGWAAQRRVRDLMLFLHSHGVGGARAARIHRHYGDAAIDRIRGDPYCLSRDIRGIGFPSADALAARLGVPRDAPARARAGLRHVLAEAQSEGHCALSDAELRARTEKLLELPERAVATALERELAEGGVLRDTVEGTDCIFPTGLYRAERGAAGRLRARAGGPTPWPSIDPERALPWAERHLGLALSESQRDALRVTLGAKLAVVTGGPGVGKTTLVRALLAILGTKGVRPALAAPTGRAARRLQEATGLEARTLHRWLEADPRSGGFRRDERHPLPCDLLVVDETSMVDVPLLAALLRALPDEAALLLIGDADQLPSVGPGQVLADVIASGVAPVIRLREVFRQAAASRIVQSAHRIHRGELPDLEPDPQGDFFFVEAETPERAAERLLEVVTRRIPRRFGLDPVRDVQVLSPMNRGSLGTRALNAALQSALNPPRPAEPRVERFGWSFGAGDKVMQLENDYERDVYNGDVGAVRAVDLEQRELAVSFEGREVAYGFEELDALALAYATSVHKAQGSEYPAVVIPVSTQHYPMLRRNLLYTAITRGRRLVVLVGERRALAIAVRGARVARRWSKLREWLAAAPPDQPTRRRGEEAASSRRTVTPPPRTMSR